MIGTHVTYVDEYGKPHDAVVTADWGQSTPDNPSSLNLVYVSSDESQTDQYGRQIARPCSVVHESQQGAHGRYWK